MSQFVKYCWPMHQMLLINQYNAVPAAVVRKMNLDERPHPV